MPVLSPHSPTPTLHAIMLSMNELLARARELAQRISDLQVRL
ncbi:MAG TPA: hypothetical protein PJ994_08055 [Tepidiformaceae bacterium]|nr:hypothetical protein [Tepidiformaceae bacterium]